MISGSFYSRAITFTFQSIAFCSLLTSEAFSMQDGDDSQNASLSSSSVSCRSPAGAHSWTVYQSESGYITVLSEDFKLNTEESVISEFRRRTKALKEKLGEKSWQDIKIMALKAIEKWDFEYFDPLTKDTSDELRALFGVYVAQKIDSADELSQDESDLSTLIYVLSHALIAEYGEDGFCVTEQNDWRQLYKFLGSKEVSSLIPNSPSQVARLIKELQRAVAYGSAMFARSLEDELDSDTGHVLKSLFLQCVYDDQKRRRPLVSSLGICKLLLEFARLQRIPLVIRTRLSAGTNIPSSGTVVTVYEYNGHEFVELEPIALNANSPVLVADAALFDLDEEYSPSEQDWERYAAKLDFEALWLSGAAAHHQFAGEYKYARLTESPTPELVLSNISSLLHAAKRMGPYRKNRHTQSVLRCYATTLDRALQYAGRMGSQDIFPVLYSNAIFFPKQEPSRDRLREHVTSNAEELCLEYGLNSKDAVEHGFRERAKTVREWLEPNDAWSAIQNKALSAIEKRNFTHFDPLVKDTSCELRALFCIHVAQKRTLELPLEDYEVDLVTLIYILSHALTTDYGPDGFGDGDENQPEKLHGFLSSEEVKSDISYTKTKKKLMSALERVVAYGSVMFARRFAAELKSDIGRALSALFLTQCIFDDPDRRRPVLPCFGISLLTLEVLHKWQVPFVIRTRLSVKPTDVPSSGIVIAAYEYNGSEFIRLDPAIIPINTPVVTVDAVTTQFGLGYWQTPSADDVRRYLDELNVRETWLAGAAIHDQFTSTNAEVQLVRSLACKLIVDLYNSLAPVAKQKGMSTTNRRTQFAVHTYPTAWRQTRQYTCRMAIDDEDATGPSKLPVPPRHTSYYWLGRYFQEHEVDGSQGNCGFTAIGTSREEAIQMLIENANNPETQRLLAPEIRALITQPLDEGPWSPVNAAQRPELLRRLRDRFHAQRSALVTELESIRNQINNELELGGDAQLTLEETRDYLANIEDQRAQWFSEQLQQLIAIDNEMEHYIPTPDEIVAFVQDEFDTRHEYLSYFRNGGGTLEAIARLRGVEVTVFTGDPELTPTLHVPAAPANPEMYFLHHVGGVDGQGRQFLNHFNILEEIEQEDTVNVLPILATGATNSTQPASSSSSAPLTAFFGVTSPAFDK